MVPEKYEWFKLLKLMIAHCLIWVKEFAMQSLHAKLQQVPAMRVSGPRILSKCDVLFHPLILGHGVSSYDKIVSRRIGIWLSTYRCIISVPQIALPEARLCLIRAHSENGHGPSCEWFYAENQERARLLSISWREAISNSPLIVIAFFNCDASPQNLFRRQMMAW